MEQVMDQVVDQPTVAVVLSCRHCGKPVKSKSGLTLHEKTCEKAGSAQATAGQPELEADFDEPNPYDQSTVQRVPEQRNQRPERPEQRSEQRPAKPVKGNQFQLGIGAFLVMTDYVPIILDIDFCIALGNHILEHGSPNSAIMAFAHQLKKLDGE